MLWIELVVTAYLVGLIWTIQVIHYPGFLFVDRTQFTKFQEFHVHRITWIVAPPMLIELSLAAYRWLFETPATASLSANLILVVFIWLHTFVLAVPIHNQLEQGYSEQLIKKLVIRNGLRTALWTIKLLLMLWVIINKSWI